MKEKLDSILAKDEELLWFGSPEEFETADKANGKSIRTGIIIKAVIMAAIIIAYLIVSVGDGFKAGILIMLLAIAAYLIASPFITASALRKKTGYAVTDKRLIQISSDAKGVEYAAIKSAVFRTDADGHVTLLCGKDALKLSESKWRGTAAAPVRIDSESGECECLVFYALPEADKVKALVAQYTAL